MKWYYAGAEQRKGPIGETELDELVRSGLVRDDTLVWREGMADWQTHSAVRGPRVQEVVPDIGVESYKYCVQCGSKLLVRELVTIGPSLVCATCKPTFLQRMQEGGPVSVSLLRYAGFWIRAAARLIDSVLLSIIILGIDMLIGIALGTRSITPGNPAAPGLIGLAMGVTVLINLSLAAAYEIWFVAKRGGATIGKLVTGLKVVRADGGPVKVGLATGRYFAAYLSNFTLGIGYIMAGFDDQKRALHDRICETRVVYAK